MPAIIVVDFDKACSDFASKQTEATAHHPGEGIYRIKRGEPVDLKVLDPKLTRDLESVVRRYMVPDSLSSSTAGKMTTYKFFIRTQ